MQGRVVQFQSDTQSLSEEFRGRIRSNLEEKLTIVRHRASPFEGVLLFESGLTRKDVECSDGRGGCQVLAVFGRDSKARAFTIWNFDMRRFSMS